MDLTNLTIDEVTGLRITGRTIQNYRDTNCNLRTQLRRIIKRAGLNPWPKLFQNLRSTRQTELAEEYPMHVVCAWIGNSQAVAMEHYLQITDEHFEQAAGALHNPVQHSTARTCKAMNQEHGDNEEEPVISVVRDNAGRSNNTETVKVGPVGLEPTRGFPLSGF